VSRTLYSLPCGCSVNLCDTAVARLNPCDETADCGCELDRCEEAKRLYGRIEAGWDVLHTADEWEEAIVSWEAHGACDAAAAGYARLRGAS